MGGNSSLYIIILSSSMAVGIVVVEVGSRYIMVIICLVISQYR